MATPQELNYKSLKKSFQELRKTQEWMQYPVPHRPGITTFKYSPLA